MNVPPRAAVLRRAYLQACMWDVMARKPGNVSLVSGGHRMQAQQFVESAQASVAALVRPGATVGERIESAVAATWQRVGCNTNLGIVLLCAPLARAAEQTGVEPGAPAEVWRAAWRQTMQALTHEDAACAFRAIALAQPAGLGRVDQDDVHGVPSGTLGAAMALAANRDRIAAQYCDDAATLFDIGLPVLAARSRAERRALFLPGPPGADGPGRAAAAAVQAVFLHLLASGPDSHIVRKHGLALAHSVMAEARPWRDKSAAGVILDEDPAFPEWDESLKARSINPGTTADLTVATLMLAALCEPQDAMGC